MKRGILLLLTAMSGILLRAQDRPFLEDIPAYIENPTVFERGQEEGRTGYLPAEHVSLDGQWKFFLCDRTADIPKDFFKPDFRTNAWKDIKVPSNWEMQGFGDKLFRNVAAPFHTNPPHVPDEYNPTGLYRRSFRVPDDWQKDGKQIFLRLEKVASAFFLWINGQEAGYNEGAQEPSEFNITPYLKRGENTLAMCVFKYSDGYYLEGQDYWRLAGVFDHVWLYATPPTRIFDWQVITDFDETYTDAKLTVNVSLRNYGKPEEESYRLKATLKAPSGEVVTQFASDKFQLNEPLTAATLRAAVKKPKKWTSETPALYSLTLSLTDARGTLRDRIDTRIGFKKTEIRNGVFLLNGVPLKVNAVNSHMQHPEWGHTMDEATIRKDLSLLKQFNFNAVRTSHYPPVQAYLDLADEYGIYVIDETGDEAHATEWLSNEPEYEAMYRERCRRMVLRDRNHPCVLFWSAGNESGEGENITKVIEEGKSLDKTRFWMYGGNAFAHPAEDIIGPRYPTPMELETQVGLSNGKDRRPSFMDEYLSVAGNGGGGLDDYWEVIYRHPRLMGGAIWDFVSPGLTERTRLLEDSSPHHTPAHLMGNARLAKDVKGNKVLDLNGHDQWVEVYRADNVELTSHELTLTCKVYPRELVSSCGSFITKGNHQFGLQQRGKDHLEFYLYTDKRHFIKAALPTDWERHWHRVTAIYNGKEMSLYIDGEKQASGPASGPIRNFPFPINIGRNAEIHGQETNVYICDAQLDEVGIFPKAVTGTFNPEEAALWLDFEKETDQGAYYSYGIGARTYGCIWPDRSVQPEMWQMKKSVQPLSFSLTDAETGRIEVWNRNHFTDASAYDINWELWEDGNMLQQGTLALTTAPLECEEITVPYRRPDIVPGKEYRLLIRALLKQEECWAPAGHEVAWDELELPWHIAAPLTTKDKGIPSYMLTDTTLMVWGNHFYYVFDRKEGQLSSLQVNGMEMMKKPLRLNLWRAPLANELDNWNASNANSGHWKEGYGNCIATEMYSAGIDRLIHQPLSFKVTETANGLRVSITDIELMNATGKEKKDLYIEGMQSNGILNHYEFLIHNNGTIEMRHELKPEGRMPLWFPRIGMTFTANDSLAQVKWYGRGPQENYPDRKSGYKTNIYTSTVDDMYEPYLLPQDYGLRTDVRWLQLTTKEGTGLRFKMNEHFNFNVYPYSTDHLTKATYTYQLQRQDGITVNLDYATTGVGCTARGVFPAYRVAPQEYCRTLIIIPIRENAPHDGQR